MLFVYCVLLDVLVCCVLVAVYCAVYIGRSVLFVVCCVLSVDNSCVVRCVLFAVCCVLIVACCL